MLEVAPTGPEHAIVPACGIHLSATPSAMTAASTGTYETLWLGHARIPFDGVQEEIQSACALEWSHSAVEQLVDVWPAFAGSAAANRAPARPADVNPMRAPMSCHTGVARPCGVVTPGACSAKVAAAHFLLVQRKRRTSRTTTTLAPAPEHPPTSCGNDRAPARKSFRSDDNEHDDRGLARR